MTYYMETMVLITDHIEMVLMTSYEDFDVRPMEDHGA